MIEHADDIGVLGEHFVERIRVDGLHKPTQVSTFGVKDGSIAGNHWLPLAVPHVAILNRRV